MALIKIFRILCTQFRVIDWENWEEVSLHDEISNMTEQYLKTKEQADLEEINQLFSKFFEL